MQIITSTSIREQIKQHLDANKGWLDHKLYKTMAIKDTSFYTPSPAVLRQDYINAKQWIADEFKINPQDVKRLATNPETIWDCDNMARELRQVLNRSHFKKYRKKEHNIPHNIPYEYATLQVTDISKINFGPIAKEIVHDFVMIFTTEGIYFACLMMDKVWSIDESKPNIISIGE